MKVCSHNTNKFAAILVIAALIFSSGFFAAPEPASSEPLSPEDAVKAAVDLTNGGHPTTAHAVDVAIGVLAVGYPPAGVALAAVWGMINSMSPGSDPVGEALNALNTRVTALENSVRELQRKVAELGDGLYKDENKQRIDRLMDLVHRVSLTKEDLKGHPTSDDFKRRMVNEAQDIASRFLPSDPAASDMWKWSDTRIVSQPDGTLNVAPPPAMLPPEFKILPVLESYINALVLYMGTIEYVYADNPSLIIKTYGPDLLKHAAFLSVTPTWQEFTDIAATLPEQVMSKVTCQLEPVSRYPDKNGQCTAACFCDDQMRRTRQTLPASTFTMPNNKDICMLSVRPQKEVSAQEQKQRITQIRQTPVYGSQAMTLWAQWGGRHDRVDGTEDDMENAYGLGTMTLIADKLERLAKTGSSREQFIGTFDFTYYFPEFLYAIKPNGDLLWQKHTIGIDKNTPQPTKDWLHAKQIYKSHILSSPGVEQAGNTSEVDRRGVNPKNILPPSTRSPQKTLPPIVLSPMPELPPPPRIFHKMEGPKLVATGWQDFREVLPAGLSSIYALSLDGVLKWYRHDGFIDGSMNWKGPINVGTGWNTFTKVIAGGDGILYGILPNGDLRWYRHTDVADAALPPTWSGPLTVGSSWQSFVHVFSGGEGVLYAVTPDGKLLWYRHKGYLTGESQWEGPKEVGTGWASFKRIFSPGEGMVYGLKSDGTLLWYQHNGYQDGKGAWQGPTQINAGWDNFTLVFPRMWGTPAAPALR